MTDDARAAREEEDADLAIEIPEEEEPRDDDPRVQAALETIHVLKTHGKDVSDALWFNALATHFRLRRSSNVQNAPGCLLTRLRAGGMGWYEDADEEAARATLRLLGAYSWGDALGWARGHQKKHRQKTSTKKKGGVAKKRSRNRLSTGKRRSPGKGAPS